MEMAHTEIEQQEIIERYVRDDLAPDERRAFQEHFFTCDECFERVQMTERFIAGVRHAAEAGIISPDTSARPQSKKQVWMRPAFALMTAASAALAVAVAWLLLAQVPQLRGELARERQLREQAERDRQQELESVQEQLQAERSERERLENQAREQAQNKTEGALAQVTRPQANVPLVMLEATRAGEPASLTVPASAKSVVLWIEVEPGARFESFRLEMFAANGQLVQRVDGLRRNAYGALAASLPAAQFQPEKYKAKLYGVSRQQVELIGEYSLQIRKQ